MAKKKPFDIKKRNNQSTIQKQGRGVGDGLGQYAFMGNNGGGSGSEAGSIVFEYPATTNLNGQKVIALVGTSLVLADSSTLSHCDSVIGLTKTAVTAPNNAEIIRFGSITSVGWGLTVGDRYYLGLNGEITNTAPVTGFVQNIGIAVTSDTLQIGLDLPIKLV